MAAKRHCGRFVGLALISGPILAVGLFCAGPAQADAASFLSDVHSAGIGDFGGGDPALLLTGQRLCQQLSYGAPAGQLQALALQRSDADLGPNGLSPQEADLLVNYAQADLCPSA